MCADIKRLSFRLKVGPGRFAHVNVYQRHFRADEPSRYTVVVSVRADVQQTRSLSHQKPLTESRLRFVSPSGPRKKIILVSDSLVHAAHLEGSHVTVAFAMRTDEE